MTRDNIYNSCNVLKVFAFIIFLYLFAIFKSIISSRAFLASLYCSL